MKVGRRIIECFGRSKMDKSAKRTLGITGIAIVLMIALILLQVITAQSPVVGYIQCCSNGHVLKE